MTEQTKDKTVVLVNRISLHDELHGDKKVSKLTIGTWSKEQQKKFIKSLDEYKPEDDDLCECCFDVEYGSTLLCKVGLKDGGFPIDLDDEDEFKDANEDEFAIKMSPCFDEDKSICCKCGATLPYQCPLKIKNGECTAPSIIKLVGSVLFSDKYFKQR